MAHPFPINQSPFARPASAPAGGAGAGTAAASAPWKADYLCIGLAIMICVYVWRFHQMNLPGLQLLKVLRVPMLVGIWLPVMFMGDHHPMRKVETLKSSKVFRLMLWLMGLMILGVPTSLYISMSAQVWLYEVVPNVMLMTLTAACIRRLEDVEFLAWVTVIGAFLYSLYVYLFIPMARGGRLSHLVYYDANDFPILLSAAIPLAVYFLRPGTSALKRGFALLALGMFAMMVIRCGSRGGFITFVAVMGYVLLRFRSIPATSRLFAVVAGGAVFAVFGSANFWTQMGTILHPQDDYNWKGGSINGRYAVWSRGIGYMIGRPITGVGLRGFPIAEGHSDFAMERDQEGKGFKWSVAHNTYVEIGAELGFPALVVFILIFATGIKEMAQVRSTGPPELNNQSKEVALAQMCLAAVVGFMVGSMWVSTTYFAFLYLLLGLTIGMTKLYKLGLLAGNAPVPAIAGAPGAVGPVVAAPVMPVPQRPSGSRPAGPSGRPTGRTRAVTDELGQMKLPTWALIPRGHASDGPPGGAGSPPGGPDRRG